MTDLTAIHDRLRENRRVLIRLRKQSREKWGPDKANWPLFRLEHIQRLKNQCSIDDRTLREAYWPAQASSNAATPSRRAILSLVVDNEKAFSR